MVEEDDAPAGADGRAAGAGCAICGNCAVVNCTTSRMGAIAAGVGATAMGAGAAVPAAPEGGRRARARLRRSGSRART